MTIRSRLTFWYAGILFVSALLIGGLSYHELLAEKARDAATGDVENDDEGLGEVAKIILWCGVPAALVGVGGGWFLTRKALAPVAALTQATEKITTSNLHERLPRIGNGDELDRLTEVFNSMIARLENSFQQIREFTLHASHELKTPLTVMRGEFETTLREEKNLSESQREHLLSQIDEIQRLTKIVDGLALLTKADAGQIQLNQEPLRLDELVRDSFADAQILAQAQSVQVCLTACEEITLRGDRHRLRQLLLNLTDNAIKYNQPNGMVNIELRRAKEIAGGEFAELKISNTGAGIAPEFQTRVFERFFRCDPSHNNAVEGCGLGLSIAQWIATAHDGSISLRSQPEKLTTLIVRLPIATGSTTG